MCPPRQPRCTDTAMLALSVSDWRRTVVERAAGEAINREPNVALGRRSERGRVAYLLCELA